jgi:hypothetical protein
MKRRGALWDGAIRYGLEDIKYQQQNWFESQLYYGGGGVETEEYLIAELAYRLTSVFLRN